MKAVFVDSLEKEFGRRLAEERQGALAGGVEMGSARWAAPEEHSSARRPTFAAVAYVDGAHVEASGAGATVIRFGFGSLIHSVVRHGSHSCECVMRYGPA